MVDIDHIFGNIRLADLRFSGVQSYTQFVPAWAIRSGIVGNLTRDIPATDTNSYSADLSGTVEGPRSLDYTHWLLAAHEGSTPEWVAPYREDDHEELSSMRPWNLELFQFANEGYFNEFPLSSLQALSSDNESEKEQAERELHNIQFVVRHLSSSDGDDFVNDIQYMPATFLSALSGEVSASNIIVDESWSNEPQHIPSRRSLQLVEDYESSGEDVHQLYEFNTDYSFFDNQYRLRFDDDSSIPQNELSGDFVMRRKYTDAGGDNLEIAYQEGL